MSFEIIRWTVLGLYFALLLVLSAYGAHRWYLIQVYRRLRDRAVEPASRFESLPQLTVQLPLYNERYVAERLIDAVCSLDYPRDRLQIQVLDDSTDDTRERTAACVAARRRLGFDIEHIHRAARTGFKAGALDAGLAAAKGELVAVFDADFVPDPDFARRLVHYFTDPEVGMVQARWGHLNSGHSALTRVQSILLDGHFVIEHTARNRSGCFFNFNGTAGIWRRRCIEEAGGWQHDTLTEDLDLSYRAQLAGWNFVYVPEHVAPAELPVEMGAFKSQQHRWAKGSMQTAKKLLPTILRSRLPWRVKLEAAVHLTANIGYVLMVGLALLVVPAIWLRADIAPWMIALVDLPIFALSTLSVASFYLVAHGDALGHRKGLYRWIPFLMSIGIGLSINNARAVIEALLGHESEFRRTPKYNLERGDTLAARSYRITINRDTWLELALAIWFAIGIGMALFSRLWGAVPFLLLFAGGYGYTALTTLAQALQKSSSKPARV